MAADSGAVGASGVTGSSASSGASFDTGSFDTGSFNSWYGDAKSTILNLNSSDDDIIKFIGQEFQQAGTGGADSDAKRSALQQLVDLRSRVSSAMSTILQTLAQTAQLVIANMRAS